MRNLRLVLFAAALGGCSFAPKYERPAAPIANQYPGGNQSGVAAADLGWRDVFSDPRLQRLIELALRNNRDLRVATLNVELARAQYRIQRSQQLPTVNAIGSSEIGRTGVAGGFERVGLAMPAFEIDLFGRVRNLKAQALEQYFATAEAQRAAHLSLVSAVVAQYLRERAFEEQRVIATQTLETVRESQAMTQRLLDAGQRSDLDARTAEAQVEGARAEVARLTRLRAQAENALVLLIGQPLPGDLPAGQPLDTQGVVADIPSGLPSDLLQRRPDVLAAEHALKGANYNIGAARAAFFPTISLTAFAGFVSPSLSKLFTSDAGQWSFTPQASLPLFTGGRNKANLDASKVRKQIEIARYEGAIQNAFREVADGLIARASFDEQLAAQTARATAEQKRFAISEARYQNGVESYVAVLSAQQDLYASQQQLVELRFARLASLADLYKALGGGWLERTQQAR
ncbi:MAG: efflux transporter outer membrane subunit [Kofleriaceae bacterium]